MRTITISDWAIIWATVIGPIVAVGVSLFVEHRRQKKAVRLNLLHTLLNAMSVPGDPAYQMAMKGIAIEYRNDQPIMTAHREVRNAARAGGDGTVTAQKLVALIVLLFARTGTRLSEDDVRGLDYTTIGFEQNQRKAQDALDGIVRAAVALEAIAKALQDGSDPSKP